MLVNHGAGLTSADPGVLGVVRAGRWARRRVGRSRLLFYVLPVGVACLLLSGAAATAVFALRLFHYARLRSADDVRR